jgi:probable phosphoglycerate mutase
MRLLFFRHGDPDYEADSLTEKGKKEAALLAETVQGFNIDDVYVSPLGRAADTAEYSLKKLGKEAVTCQWLMEFPAQFDPELADDKTRRAYCNELSIDEKTGKFNKRIVWDVMPSYYMDHQELFDVNAWRESELVRCTDMPKLYEEVTTSFDKLMAEYGYDRRGRIYDVRKSSDKVIAFFCHFGITSILLSYIWNVSPFVTLQNLAMAPTSVTELVTEEREKGIAIFRTLRTGDITHLTMGDEQPSFSARFCERFENEDERH